MSAQSFRLYIGGEWREAVSGRRFEVTNPATGEVVATVPDAGPEDARAAIEAAHGAFVAWSSLPAHVRARYMRKLYDLIVANADRLARALTEENGKPLAEARGEVLNGAEYLELVRRGDPARVRRDHPQLVPADPHLGAPAAGRGGGRHHALELPVLHGHPEDRAALAAGCTVVLKPAEQTPLSALLVAELIQEAGLPAGVVNIITTRDPASVGQAFLSNRLSGRSPSPVPPRWAST